MTAPPETPSAALAASPAAASPSARLRQRQQQEGGPGVFRGYEAGGCIEGDWSSEDRGWRLGIACLRVHPAGEDGGEKHYDLKYTSNPDTEIRVPESSLQARAQRRRRKHQRTKGGKMFFHDKNI